MSFEVYTWNFLITLGIAAHDSETDESHYIIIKCIYIYIKSLNRYRYTTEHIQIYKYLRFRRLNNPKSVRS
jgi:hypothetical protein